MKIRKLNESIDMENSEALAKVAKVITAAKKEYDDILSEANHCTLVVKGIEELFTGKSENGSVYQGQLKVDENKLKEFLEESDFRWVDSDDSINGTIKFEKINIHIMFNYQKETNEAFVMIADMDNI